MEVILGLIIFLSFAIIIICLISLIIKAILKNGASYKTHFISMGISAALLVCSVIFAALDVSGNDDISVDNEVTTQQFANKENESENQKQDTEADRVQSSDEEFYFDGTDLVTNNYSIKITGYKVIQSGEDSNYSENQVIKFSYETTVDEDVTNLRITPDIAWFSTFKVVQDNDPDVVNDLDLIILVDDDGSISQNPEIKPGGTASNSMAYELTDEETPVTLIAVEDRVFNDEIGSHDYSIK